MPAICHANSIRSSEEIAPENSTPPFKNKMQSEQELLTISMRRGSILECHYFFGNTATYFFLYRYRAFLETGENVSCIL